MIVLIPLDRAAAQTFGIDLEIFHGRTHFGGVGWPARALERRLDRHAADPAFRHSLRRIFRAGLFGRVFDFLLYRQALLEQCVGIDHEELAVFKPCQLAFGLKMAPGNVVVLPIELAERFQCADLVTHGAQE